MEKVALHALIVSNKFELLARVSPKWFLDDINSELYKNSLMCLKEKDALTDTLLKTHLHENIKNEYTKQKLLSRLNEIVNMFCEYPANFVRVFQNYYVETMLEKYYNHHIGKDSTFESKYALFQEIHKQINDNSFVTDSINLRDNIQEYLKLLETGEADLFTKNSIPLENEALIPLFGKKLRPWPVVIGAAPTRHKTSLLIDLIMDIDKQKLPGLIFSFEDTIDTFRAKYLAMKYDIHTERVINNNFICAEYPKIIREVGYKNRIWVVEKPCTLIKFRELVDKHVNMHNIRWIAIDYFQEFIVEKGKTKADSLEDFAREFVNIRKDHNIPVICLSQVTEENGSEPNLNSCKWCKALGEKARQAIFMWGEEKSNLRYCKHGKNTFAGSKKFNIKFSLKNQRIEELSEYEEKNN